MRPNFAITEVRNSHDHKVFTVDTSKATFKGIPWKTLGGIGKQNFEDLIVLSNIKDGLVKVLYV